MVDGKSGIISTVAGTGTAGFSGDGGPGVEAQLNSPTDIFVDTAGNIYVADSRNYRIRRIDPDGIITTVAGNEEWPQSVHVDKEGKVLVGSHSSVRSVGMDGIVSSVASEVAFHIAGDAVGNLFVGGDSQIRRVDTIGIVTTVPVPLLGHLLTGLWVDGNGDLIVADGGDDRPAIQIPPRLLRVEDVAIPTILNGGVFSADTTPPALTSCTSCDGLAVDPDLPIRLGFDEPIDTSRVQIEIEHFGQSLPFVLEWSEGNSKLTLSPSPNYLGPNSLYRLHLSEVADLTGNEISLDLRFSTFPAPGTVSSTSEPGEVLWLSFIDKQTSDVGIGHNGEIYLWVDNPPRLISLRKGGSLRWQYTPSDVKPRRHNEFSIPPMITPDQTVHAFYYFVHTEHHDVFRYAEIDTSGQVMAEFDQKSQPDNFFSGPAELGDGSLAIGVNRAAYIVDSNRQSVTTKRLVYNLLADDRVHQLISVGDSLVFGGMWAYNSMHWGYSFRSYTTSLDSTWTIRLSDAEHVRYVMDRGANAYLTVKRGPPYSGPQPTFTTKIDPSGTVVWSVDDLRGNILLDGYGILYAPMDDTLRAVSSSSGETYWTKKVPGEGILGTPVIGDAGVLYFASEDGAIRAFSTRSLEILWTSPLGFEVKELSMNGDGDLIVRGPEHLVTVATESSGPDTLNFPMRGQNPQKTNHISTFDPNYFEREPPWDEDALEHLATAVAVADGGTLPDHLELAQNFPNPFNSGTEIRFSVPHRGRGSLSIYTILGVRIGDYDLGDLGTGSHRFAWDGADQDGRRVASGVYLYKLTFRRPSGVEEESVAKSMVLVQ